jgi:hypothetical protein
LGKFRKIAAKIETGVLRVPEELKELFGRDTRFVL